MSEDRYCPNSEERYCQAERDYDAHREELLMSRYEPTRKEFADNRCQCRAEAEEQYYKDNPKSFLERCGEVARELQEFHRAFIKRSPF